MIALKEQIKEGLEFLNEEQLIELADFTVFLKVRSRIQNSNMKFENLYSMYSNEDKILADSGMAEYNAGLLEEDRL